MTVTITHKIDSSKAQALYDAIKHLPTARILYFDHRQFYTNYSISIEDSKDYYDFCEIENRLNSKLIEVPEASWLRKQFRKFKCLFG